MLEENRCQLVLTGRRTFPEGKPPRIFGRLAVANLHTFIRIESEIQKEHEHLWLIVRDCDPQEASPAVIYRTREDGLVMAAPNPVRVAQSNRRPVGQ